MRKVNKANFKKTLGKFTTGITIVCVKEDDQVYGKTVNSFNSLSLDPPMVLFSLGNYSSSIKNFLSCKYLTINILSYGQKSISNHFSTKNPISKNINFLKGKNNTALIDGCIGNLECKLIDKIKQGDHIIFICKVIRVQSKDKIKPLSYFNSKYY